MERGRQGIESVRSRVTTAGQRHAQVTTLAVQPPLAEWSRRGQPAHTPPERPPGAEGKGRHKVRKGQRLEKERRREN
eukprot:366571-Chlamydomonas_euryale.AAC.29